MQNGEKKVVLAYSGGLDTSVAIKWLQEKNYDIIALCLDLGEGKDLAFVKEKALSVGAIKSYMIDVQEEFANEYALMAMQAHTLYEGIPSCLCIISSAYCEEISRNRRTRRRNCSCTRMYRERK